AELQLGEPYTDPVEVYGVLHLTGNRWSGQAGVDAQRQPDLGTFGVQRIVDGIARRILPVAPEAWTHNGIRDRKGVDDRAEFAQRRHRPQQVDAAHREREPVWLRFDEFARRHRRLREVIHQHSLADTVLVHLFE